jgi:hypothetical protein
MIVCDGEVAGRLEPVRAGVEIGIWLGRRARCHGVGRAAVDLLVEQARTDGHLQLVASTTAGNSAAVRLLDALGASLTTQNEAGRQSAAPLTADPWTEPPSVRRSRSHPLRVMQVDGDPVYRSPRTGHPGRGWTAVTTRLTPRLFAARRRPSWM